MAQLSLMHVGAVVADLDAAIADHALVGATDWVTSGPLSFRTFDGARGAVVGQDVRLAFGRLPGGVTIELVEPAASTPDSPQRRLLEHSPGVTHVAYWCRSVVEAARPLLAAGASVFTVSVPPDVAVVDPDAGLALLERATAAYLRTATRSLVELVSVDVAPSLRTMFGPQIDRALSVPELR